MSETQEQVPQQEQPQVEQVTGPKEIFMMLPIPGYPHPLRVGTIMVDELRLELAAAPDSQKKKMMTTILLNMLGAAIEGVQNASVPKQEQDSLIIKP